MKYWWSGLIWFCAPDVSRSIFTVSWGAAPAVCADARPIPTVNRSPRARSSRERRISAHLEGGGLPPAVAAADLDVGLGQLLIEPLVEQLLAALVGQHLAEIALHDVEGRGRRVDPAGDAPDQTAAARRHPIADLAPPEA